MPDPVTEGQGTATGFDVADFRERWRALGGKAEVCAQTDSAETRVCILDRGHPESHPWDAPANADDLETLAWFFKMVESGGPDISDLDHAVWDDAKAAAERALAYLGVRR